MRAKVVKFEYTRNKPSVKYLLVCQKWDRNRDLIGYDITQLANQALRDDRARGFHGDTGPNLGWLVHKALKAGEAHVEVLTRWNISKGREDRDFRAWKDVFMRHARRSVDVYDWTRNFVEPDYDELYFLDQVEKMGGLPDVPTNLDFKPKIGLENGVWRNYKAEFINFLKEYQWDV